MKPAKEIMFIKRCLICLHDRIKGNKCPKCGSLYYLLLVKNPEKKIVEAKHR